MNIKLVIVFAAICTSIIGQTNNQSLFNDLGFSSISGEHLRVRLPRQLLPADLSQATSAPIIINGDPNDPLTSKRKAEIEQLDQEVKKRIATGSVQLRKFDVSIGINSGLAYIKEADWAGTDENPPENIKWIEYWCLQDSNSYVEYQPQNNVIIIKSGAGGPSSRYGDILSGFGNLGQLNRLESSLKKSLEANLTNKRFVEVKLVDADGFLTKITPLEGGNISNYLEKVDLPTCKQTISYDYLDYKRFDKLNIPMRIVNKFNNSVDEVLNKIKVGTCNFEARKKLALPAFKYVQVIDNRTNPPLNYFTFGEIPSDEMLVEFIRSPALIGEFVKSAQQKRRNALRLPIK